MKLLFSIIPRLSVIFSGGNIVKASILCLKLWYFAFSRKLIGRSKDFSIHVFFRGREITFYLRYVMDLAVLQEIFINKEYEWCPVENPEIIIDLGAHFGDTALYYHARFPDAKIIAIEPSPENYARLEKHVKDISNIIPVQMAIGAADGEISLNIMPSTLGHSVLSRKETEKTVHVQQLSLSSLFKKFDVETADLVKFDIEGAEFNMLNSIDPIKYSKAYIGELHFDISTEHDLDWVQDIFRDFQLLVEPLQNKKRFILKASTD